MSDADDRTSTISLAYSVDADDAFMFHALRAGAIDTRGLTFTHTRAHTAALNQLAIDAGADVVAVSVGRLSRDRGALPDAVARRVGRAAGSVPSWSRRGRSRPRDLAGLRVGIPGATTTAWLVLRLIAPGRHRRRDPDRAVRRDLRRAGRRGGGRGAADPRRAVAVPRSAACTWSSISARGGQARDVAAAAAGRERRSAARWARRWWREVSAVVRAEHRLGPRAPRRRSSPRSPAKIAATKDWSIAA